MRFAKITLLPFAVRVRSSGAMPGWLSMKVVEAYLTRNGNHLGGVCGNGHWAF